MQCKPETFKNLYLGYLAGSIGAAAFWVAAMGIDAASGHQRGDPPSVPAVILMLLGVLCIIAGVVSYCVLLYRSWNQIQDGQVRTTPGKAVGFLFIPFFNFYWMFVAVYGLSQDLNRYTTQRSIGAPRVAEGLAMTVCILVICSIIPCLGIFVALVNLPLTLIVLWQITDASRAVARAKIGTPPPITGGW